MELEYEGHYPACIFVSAKVGKGGAKKRYAMIDDKDNLVIKGFESVRRNTARIAKEVQKKVLGIILKENDPEKAYNYVRDVVGKIKNKELEVSNFIIATKLTKDLSEYDSVGPHVEIARRMRESGRKIEPGSVVRYVICEGKGLIRDKVKEADSASREEIDPEYYLNNQVFPVVDKIFEVLGYNVYDLAKNQSRLDKFF